MSAYYNEVEPYAAEWLRNLIKAGHIADGEVDTRSIVDVSPDDLRGFTQCHFFAGIGGWSLAARLAEWPDDRPLWTGSCPCQPFSVAGQGKGQADERHLWPEYLRLISACRPPIVMGEQVAAAVGKSWLDGVYDDLESIGYACGAVVVPACAVGAPHRRDRLWFVADAKGGGWGQRVEDARRVPERIGTQGAAGRSTQHGDVRPMADADSGRPKVAFDAGKRGEGVGSQQLAGGGSIVADADSQRAYTRERNDQAARYGDTTDAEGVSNGVDVANPRGGRLSGPGEGQGKLARGAKAVGAGEGDVDNAKCARLEGFAGHGNGGGRRAGEAGSTAKAGESIWADAQWLTGADGKARRFEPGIRLLAHGVPARVGKLRAYGNAIVPQVAAEVIAAFMECEP